MQHMRLLLQLLFTFASASCPTKRRSQKINRFFLNFLFLYSKRTLDLRLGSREWRIRKNKTGVSPHPKDVHLAGHGVVIIFTLGKYSPERV